MALTNAERLLLGVDVVPLETVVGRHHEHVVVFGAAVRLPLVPVNERERLAVGRPRPLVLLVFVRTRGPPPVETALFKWWAIYRKSESNRVD